MSVASESNRVPQDSPAIRLIQIILAITLLGTLVGAGRRIYRTLPTAFGAPGETLRSGAQQDLTIIFRAAVSAGDTRVNLYPIDFSATERDYLMNARPAPSLLREDFVEPLSAFLSRPFPAVLPTPYPNPPGGYLVRLPH